MAFLDNEGLSRLWTHIIAKLGDKVNVEAGKGLSTNDYTTEEKEKLASLATPDWNANKGETGHIENRTHWVENKQQYILPIQLDLEFSSLADGVEISFAVSDAIELVKKGEIYQVLWNSTLYECVAQEEIILNNKALTLGNTAPILNQFGAGVSTSDPFAIIFTSPELLKTLGNISEDDNTVFISYGEAPGTIVISSYQPFYNKLDFNYLPSGYPGEKHTYQTILPETSLTFMEDEGLFGAPIDNISRNSFIFTKEYKIIYNGTEYILKPQPFEAFCAFGNLSLGHYDLPDTGEPFMLVFGNLDDPFSDYFNYIIMLKTDNSNTCLCSVDNISTEIQKIDNKYLDLSWDNLENRPFGTFYCDDIIIQDYEFSPNTNIYYGFQPLEKALKNFASYKITINGHDNSNSFLIDEYECNCELLSLEEDSLSGNFFVLGNKSLFWQNGLDTKEKFFFVTNTNSGPLSMTTEVPIYWLLAINYREAWEYDNNVYPTLSIQGNGEYIQKLEEKYLPGTSRKVLIEDITNSSVYMTDNIALNKGAVVLGQNNISKGENTFSIGSFNLVSGEGSFAQGAYINRQMIPCEVNIDYSTRFVKNITCESKAYSPSLFYTNSQVGLYSSKNFIGLFKVSKVSYSSGNMILEIRESAIEISEEQQKEKFFLCYFNCIAEGENSRAEGQECISLGYNSHAEGEGTIAFQNDQHVEGTYNYIPQIENYHTYTKEIEDYINKEVYEIVKNGISFEWLNDHYIARDYTFGPIQFKKGFIYTDEQDVIMINDDYSEIYLEKYKQIIEVNEAEGTFTYHVYNLIREQEEDSSFEKKYLHIVGNGSDYEHPSNAYTLDESGNAWFAGNVYVGPEGYQTRNKSSKKLATEEHVTSTLASYRPNVTLLTQGADDILIFDCN